MSYRFNILSLIWNENKYELNIILFINIIEEIFYLFIPSSVGLLIDYFVYGKGLGIYLFIFNYLGWQSISVYKKIYDTKIFSKIYNDLVLKIIEKRQKNKVSITKINARVELLKQIIDFFEIDFPFFVKSLIAIFGSLILLYMYNSKLLLVSIIIVIPSLLINFFYAKKIEIATHICNNQFEQQLEILENGDKTAQQVYFQELREYNIRKSTLEALNFGFLEIFVLLMILMSLFILCKTENLNYGSIIASYGIVLRLAYSFDFIPHLTTKIATLKDITNRIYFS